MLSEVKYGDLHNIRKHNTHKKLQKAYHSQGYELGDLRTDEKVGSHKRASLTHRKSGERITDDGKDFGGHGTRSDGSDMDSVMSIKLNRAAKEDMAKRGRVDKRPAAKKERKDQAAANKEKKQKDRDPFTRGKTYKEWVEWTVEELSQAY